MKTNKKSFRKAALPVFGVLAAAVMSLTSVTYAWFTSGNKAEVETINVGVQAADGLQISVGSATGSFNWQSTVKPTLDAQTLAPASSTGDVTDGALTFYTATYNDTIDKITNLAKAADAKKAYITFDLYFRNPETTAKTININGTTVTSLTGFSNLATRVAFIKQGEISTLSANQTTSAFNGKVGSTSVIYEPGAGTHTDSGLKDYQKFDADAAQGEVFAYKAVAAENATTYFNRFTGKAYDAIGKNESYAESNYQNNNILVHDASDTDDEAFRTIKIDDDFAGVTLEAALAEFTKVGGAVYTKESNTYVKYEGYDKDENPDTPLDKEINPDLTYYIFSPVERYEEKAVTALADVTTKTETEDVTFTLAKQTITKITLYIWLEGQDVDCDNTIASFAFNVDLKFGIVTTTPPPAQGGGEGA